VLRHWRIWKRQVRIKEKTETVLVVLLVLGITALIYATQITDLPYHIFYRELYFLPIILGGLWFGLRRALFISFSISLLYMPFVILHWQGLSPSDVDRIMEIFLYNMDAFILGFLRDSQQREHQRNLELERLAAMGTAMSGVAHEMKTPLVAIGGFSKMVQRRFQEDDPNYEKLDIVLHETERLENMVKEMLDFSRPLKLDRSEEDLNHVVERGLAVAGKMAEDRKVAVELHLDRDLPLIPLDTLRIEQVVINLVNNAIQASPEGEKVVVKTLRISEYAAIEVIDCGCGIPIEQRENVFTPFFSTKKEGTGLGLPIVKKIVESHNGRLELLDNPEGGIIFRFLLPMTGETAF
jgi:signal transduction histidine kinase